MKRILQSVALALAAILAVQPALATMTCAQKVCVDGISSMDCCLPSHGASMQGMSMVGMPSMSASGQAPSLLAQTGSSCSSGPCCTVSARSTPQLATPGKFSVDRVVSFTWLGEFSGVTVAVRAGPASGEQVAATPARYVLFQDFRI